MLRLKIDIPFSGDAFARFSEQMQRALRFALNRASLRIRSEVRASPDLVPVRTGWLRSTFETGVIGTSIEMRWTAYYAEVVELGAPQHKITARGPFLQFKHSKTGEWVRKKSVNHPGYPGRFFRLKVGARAMEIMNEEISAAMARIRVRAS